MKKLSDDLKTTYLTWMSDKDNFEKYLDYAEEVDLHLGDKKEDKIERGRVTVDLTRWRLSCEEATSPGLSTTTSIASCSTEQLLPCSVLGEQGEPSSTDVRSSIL